MQGNNDTAANVLTALAFFSNSGKYQVSPDTTAKDLHDDIACWLESIHGTLDLIVTAIRSGDIIMIERALYGVLYQVQMVQGALLASYKVEVQA